MLPASLAPLQQGEKVTFKREGSISVKECDYAFSFELEIISDTVITEYKSNLDYLLFEISLDNKLLKARLDPNAEFTANSDLIIYYKDFEMSKAHCIIENNNGNYTGLISILPSGDNHDLELMDGKGEFILLLDRSGSMQGKKLQMAQQAVLIFLKSLPENCKFNIVSFGTSYDLLFENSVDYAEISITEASEKLKTFKADMGGTNIYEPLEHIFDLDNNNQCPRSVFLVTDGDVTRPDLVIKLIHDNCHHTRVNAFGIGSDVSGDLIKDCAKAGGGLCSFIDDPKDISAEIINVLKKTMMPAISNLSICSDSNLDFTPKRLKTVYYGERLTVYAALGEKAPDQEIRIECYNNNIGQKMIYQVRFENLIQGSDINKL